MPRSRKTLMSHFHPKVGLRKCDAGCYNATEKACDCICMGKNHGVGYAKAREYTTLHAHEMIKAYELTLLDHLNELL